MAEAKAVARFVRVPAQKARIVADLIRGKDVNTALVQVQVTKRQAARIVEKVLRSAMANATQNHGVRDVDRLVVAEVYVNEGPTIKRIQPRAMGRAFRVRKRSSHITIVLQERVES
jgi:large subunit ribosomal protein L22